jgi:hypothetical protein
MRIVAASAAAQHAAQQLPVARVAAAPTPPHTLNFLGLKN